MRHPILLLLSVLLAPALWVIFVGSGSAHELEVGAVASVATVLFNYSVCRLSGQTLVLRFRDVVQLWRVP